MLCPLCICIPGKYLKKLDGRKCNPYFFQMLFETQSRDLTTKVFSSKSKIAPLIINPLECFVTAGVLLTVIPHHNGI